MKALYIGRFQPFHMGHLLLLQQLSKQYDEIIIGIGSSQYHDTNDNPFSESERYQMITKSLQAVHIPNYRIISIPDIHNPPKWVDYVCSIVSDFDVVIANNPLTRSLFSEKGFMVKGTVYFDRKRYSGKEIRKRILQDEPWKDLVPQAVYDIIREINGISRIRNKSS
ncbi:MAG: nicotinamide-nucleotide adenylyltransferase [Candidatus Thermoplasmatota archaeon]|jgi:nicotinamide-nucleotide adenylyltransferase|nr:nicotinamide-nucleotide adenylyltransferase [Candidatus Thermoplasmatota archaeon]